MSNTVLLDEESWRRRAKEAMKGLDTLSADERQLVLAARLRAAVEEYIKRKGSGSVWGRVIDLMAAMQNNHEDDLTKRAKDAG